MLYGPTHPLSIWYDWKNDGPDPKENEHNFGTVGLDLSPKPAYRAVSVMTHELDGFHIVRRLKLGGDDDYLLLLADKTGQTKIAAWTTGKAHDLVVKWSAKSGVVAMVAGDGARSQLSVEKGDLTIHLQPLPAYLSPGKLEIQE